MLSVLSTTINRTNWSVALSIGGIVLCLGLTLSTLGLTKNNNGSHACKPPGAKRSLL